MSRKAFACILAVLMTVSLAGCKGSSGAPSPSAAEITVTGVVTDAAMNTLTIQTTDGAVLSFLTEDASMEMKDGLLLGDTVAVTYTGDVKDGDASGATVRLVRDGADNSKNPLRLAAETEPAIEPEAAPESADAASADAAGGMEFSLTSEVVAIGMSAITLKTEDGSELSFAMDEVENTLETDPVEGDRVTLFFAAEVDVTDPSSATAVRLEVAA